MLLKTSVIYKIIYRNVSALYISGDKAHQQYAVLTPYLDFESKLCNEDKLEQNINNRKMKIDLKDLYQLWSTYKDLTERKLYLAERRIENTGLLRNLDRTTTKSADLIRKYTAEGVMLREDLRSLKENSYAIEDNFIHKFLELPNDIHERTPIDEDKILCSYFDDQNKTDGDNHLTKTDFIEYHDPYCYYLKGDAARCDLNLPLYGLKWFQSNGFVPFSNPDFIKSIIAEGAGLDPSELIGIEEDDMQNKLNLLHLVGNGSMLSFLGFVTKLVVSKHHLPLKFVSIGKEYSQPKTDNNEPAGLYSVSQTSKIQLFEISSNESESLQQFDDTLGQITEFYKRFEIPFRVSYVASAKLSQAENFRVDFEIYSFYRKSYISIGHLSSYSNYISKRLLFSFKVEKLHDYPYLISGNVMNVTTLIAILLEQKDPQFISSALGQQTPHLERTSRLLLNYEELFVDCSFANKFELY